MLTCLPMLFPQFSASPTISKICQKASLPGLLSSLPFQSWFSSLLLCSFQQLASNHSFQDSGVGAEVEGAIPSDNTKTDLPGGRHEGWDKV